MGLSSSGRGASSAAGLRHPIAYQERRCEMEAVVGIGFVVLIVLGFVFGEQSDDYD